MSEFLAEAAVLIRPDTTKFRAELVAQLRSVTRGITVPVPVVAQAARATAGSTRQTTAAIQQQTAATKQNLTAKQKQAVADRQAAAEATRLAQANNAVAAAQKRLNAVETAGQATTTELAAARARLRAAEQAELAATRAVNAAAIQGAEAARAQAAATLEAAQALIVEAKAAEQAAIANAENAAAAAEAARKQEQLRRGAGATGLSMLNIRGATLAASSSFLIGAASITLLSRAIKGAATDQAVATATTKVFGDAIGRDLAADATKLAGTFGVIDDEALRFEANVGNLLTTVGLTQQAAADLSKNFVRVGADLASFKDVPVEPVLRAIFLALSGNSRALRQYGVELNAARVNAVALRETGKGNVDQLTRQERVQARVNLILRDTAKHVGDTAEREGELSVETRQLSASLDQLSDTIGRIALPKVTELASEATFLVGALNRVGDAAAGAAAKAGGSQFGHFVKDIQTLFSPTPNLGAKVGVLRELKDLVFPKDVNRDFKELNFQGQQFSGTMDELHQKAQDLWNQQVQERFIASLLTAQGLVGKLVRQAGQVSFKNAEASLDRLNEKLDDIKIAGGPGEQGATLAALQAQVPGLQRAIAAQDVVAKATLGKSGHETAVARRRELKQELADILAQIRGINEDIAQGAKDAADEFLQIAEDAQRRVQELIDRANESLQNTIDAIARPLDFQRARAEATASLVDDVRFQQDLQKAIRAQIAVVNQMILSEAERAAKLHDLRLQLVNSQIEEKRLRLEQKKNAQERRAARFDRAAESIDLDIELAQTNKNVRAEIAAREQRIRLDIQRQKQVKGDILATKRLRNDIAEQRKAIKELKKELDKRNDELAKLEFAFLQRQTGFVTNLLSNLLPTSAVAGTVGGTGGVPATAISTSTRPPLGEGASGLGANKLGNFTSDAAARTPPGSASAGQMAALIAVNRQILHVLQRMIGQRTHPEAATAKAAQSVSMDFF